MLLDAFTNTYLCLRKSKDGDKSQPNTNICFKKYNILLEVGLQRVRRDNLFMNSVLSTSSFSKRVFKASAIWADTFYKSKYPSVCLSVHLSVCLFPFEVQFKRIFALTSQSWMSNILRDSESFGKSMGKK